MHLFVRYHQDYLNQNADKFVDCHRESSSMLIMAVVVKKFLKNKFYNYTLVVRCDQECHQVNADSDHPIGGSDKPMF